MKTHGKNPAERIVIVLFMVLSFPYTEAKSNKER